MFANETSQFLAPYEASVKSRSGSDSPPENAIGSSSRAANIPDSHRHLVGVSASHVSTWWHVDCITSVCNLSSLTQYTKIKFPFLCFGSYSEMYGGCFTHCIPDFHIPLLFEKLIVAQLAREFPVSSVHCLKGYNVGPYSDLNKSCPHSSMVLTFNTPPSSMWCTNHYCVASHASCLAIVLVLPNFCKLVKNLYEVLASGLYR